MADPTLGDLEIQRYSEDHILDEYDNMSVTIEGSVGELKLFMLVHIQIEQQIKLLITQTTYLLVNIFHIIFVMVQ